MPLLQIIGVDPVGSILALPESLNVSDISTYHVEGIGYDFIPDVLKREYIDKWVKTRDAESFTMARRLIRQEGLLCGGSSGACMAAAVRAIKDLKIGKDKRVVVIFADSVRNYMGKFLSDEWMVENGFMAPPKLNAPWADRTVGSLALHAPLTVAPTISAAACIEIMKKNGFDQMPVVSAEGTLLGVVTIGNLASRLANARITPDSPIEAAMFKQFKRVTAATTLGELSVIFDRDHYAIATVKSSHVNAEGVTEEKEMCSGVVTRIDLVNFITEFNKTA